MICLVTPELVECFFSDQTAMVWFLGTYHRACCPLKKKHLLVSYIELRIMRAHVIDELNTRFYPVDKLEQVLWWAMSWLVSKWMREKQMGVSQDAPLQPAKTSCGCWHWLWAASAALNTSVAHHHYRQQPTRSWRIYKPPLRPQGTLCSISMHMHCS